MDARLSKIEVHDALHGFRAKRGCRTGIMEAKCWWIFTSFSSSEQTNVALGFPHFLDIPELTIKRAQRFDDVPEI